MNISRGAIAGTIVLVLIASGAMALAGANPLFGFGALLRGALGGTHQLSETLVQTTSLLFPSLAVAFAFRAGLFNIGAEGQLVIGGLAAGVTGAALDAPGFIAVPAILVAGAFGGGVWGGVAGLLRARFGGNEVIATLMLNIVAALLANYLVAGPLHTGSAEGAETSPLPASSWLPTLVPDTRLTIALVIALVLAAGLAFVFSRTVFGYELRAAGLAPAAALRAGIDLGRTALVAMTLSGAIAGLGGATIVAGILHRFNVALSPGYGFVAIAVALVGGLDPLRIVLASFAFGVLQSGSLTMQAIAHVPKDAVTFVEGLIVLGLATRRFAASGARARERREDGMNAIAAFALLTLVKATPLVYAALAGVVCERSGILNIALEGALTAGAFGAVATSYATGSPLLGILAGMAAGVCVCALLGIAATRFGVDQIVAGTGLNIVAAGGTAFALVIVFGQPGASPEVRALGSGGEAALVAGALACAVLLHLLLSHTPWGLRLRACGENPRAVRSAGVDPARVRVIATILAGTLAGAGGVFLSLGELDLYSDGMTAGRGFIALAAVIFGRWTPLGAAAAALAFGALSALQFTLQRAGIPSELMQALPYLAALAALTGITGRARAPTADGVALDA